MPPLQERRACPQGASIRLLLETFRRAMDHWWKIDAAVVPLRAAGSTIWPHASTAMGGGGRIRDEK